eukprot:Phypoly_transcript_07137.p1 GENE.Phypoly_transcript_07137~~Phypoly_transcript_07137.p1  ORF type:complete len:538 (+),score=92.56 Phypoly_transcript_07137:80-1615(+)
MSSNTTTTSTDTTNTENGGGEEPQQDQFLKDLNNFMKQRGTPIPPAPSIGGHPFDLQALYKHVTDRGGLENVLKEKLWNSIVQLVELPTDCTNPAYTLRVLYLKYLYAYERQRFLYIDNDEKAIDYTPKVRSSQGNVGSAKPAVPMNRPVLRLDYRRTPLPADSTRLRNKIKDILQLQKICFALRSGTATTVQWGLEVLALKSYQGEVVLRSGVVGSSEEVHSLSVGNALLSALADLGKSYYTTAPSLIWKSEKVSDTPNETQILAILRNLTLVPQNGAEMAVHTKCVEILILALSHPSPTCVEDALETLASLSYHLVLGWDEQNGEEKGDKGEKEKEEVKPTNSGALNAEASKNFVNKITDLFCEGMAASLTVLANLTGQASNWPHLETVFAEVSNLVDRLDAVINSGDESGYGLKTIFHISRYGTKTKQQVILAKGIMLFLVRTLGQPKSDEEIDDTHQLVVDTLINFCSDPATKQSALLYESELLHFILLESPASDSVANILSTLAAP